jgi:hypothetical protein
VEIRALSKRQGIVIIFVIAVWAIATVYYEFYYIPPPSTTTAYSYCKQTGSASINDSFSSIAFSFPSSRWKIDLQPNVSELAISSPCVYNSTIVTVPVRCGVMCGDGVSNIIEMTKQL